MRKPNFRSAVQPLKALLLPIALAAPLLVAGTVFAQGADDAIEEIVVSGVRQSLDTAAEIKRNADTIADAITAEDIGVFSDNNIGEALSRIPGVQLERSEGEGYRISVRGLGPKFVRTTLNGRTALSSPGGENGRDARGFSFNIIPSEVINKAQVYKSFRAIDIEGGIGGTVNLETVRPLEFAGSKKQDFYVSGALRSTYNDLGENNRPRGSIFANYKVSDQFGFFISGVFDTLDRKQHSTESQDLDIERFDLAAGTIVNGVALTEETRYDAALFDGVRNFDRNRDGDRLTFTGGFQWQPTDSLDVNFDWTHGAVDLTRNDYRSWMRVEDAVDRFADDVVTSMIIDTQYANDASDGTIMAFEFEGFEANGSGKVLDVAHLTQVIDETIDTGGINVSWSNDDGFTLTADLGFTAQEKVTNQRRVTFGEDKANGRYADGFNGSFDIRSGYPIVTLADTNGVAFDHTSEENITFDADRVSLYLEDNQEVNFRLDAETELDNDFINALKFGLSYRNKDLSREELRTNRDWRDRDENGDRIWEDIPITAAGSRQVTGFFPDVPGVPTSYTVPDFWAWMEADLTGTYAKSPYDGAARIGREYNVGEEVAALYIQFDFSNDDARFPFRGNAGLRYVDSQQTSFGIFGQQDGNDVIIWDPNRVIDNQYSNWLPSVNLAMDLTDDWVLRFAASKSVTRPDPVDLRVGVDLDTDDLDGSQGNPDLQPYGTDNFDVSLEWYPEVGGAYAIGVFYKKMDGWIVETEMPIVHDTPATGEETFDVDLPVNTDGGIVQGLEFSFHLPFDTFSEAMAGFGIQGSFTLIDAKMDAIDPVIDEPVSLPGTSDTNANLVAYYEKGRFGSRLAYTYREDFLHQTGAEGWNEFNVGGEFVDLNLDWRFNDSWRVRFSANNLTDNQSQRYFLSPGQMSRMYDDGQTYVIELRGNFTN
jgi:iron complex outermembrane receptor protein